MADKAKRPPQLNVALTDEGRRHIDEVLEKARQVLGMPNLSMSDMISASVTFFSAYLDQRKAGWAAEVANVGEVQVEARESARPGRPRVAPVEPAPESAPKRGRGRPRKTPPGE